MQDEEQNVSEAPPQNEQPSADQEAPPADLTPVCPWCTAEPFMPTARIFTAGRDRLLIIYCQNGACRKVVGTFLLPPIQPRVVPAAPKGIRLA